MVQPQETHRPPLRTVMESYVNVTGATYAAKAGDRLIGVNRAGTVTVTLPSAQLRAGRTYTIKDESGAAATNNITVATEGSETIDGSATDTVGEDYGSKAYYSDGFNWFTVPLLAVASHTLASHSSKAHADLTSVGSDDHHAQSHTLDSHSAGTLQHEKGGLEADVNAGDGFVEIKAGATTVIKSNTAASAAPGANDDSAAGYAVGSVWIDTTNDKAYVCLDATATAAVWSEITQAGGGTSKLFQFVSTQTGAVATTTTTMPFDDTIPQNNEGGEFMTLAITPDNTSNKLIIEVTFVFAWSAAGGVTTVALFQDSTADALAAVMGNGNVANIGDTFTFTHVMDAGTTSPTTFKVRAGTHTSGTLTFNGLGGSRYMGGVLASGIRIWEYVV